MTCFRGEFSTLCVQCQVNFICVEGEGRDCGVHGADSRPSYIGVSGLEMDDSGTQVGFKAFISSGSLWMTSTDKRRKQWVPKMPNAERISRIERQ